MLYKMAIYFNKKVVYQLDVEADSIEYAREQIWDEFEQVACADEYYSPCGDCAEYPDCTKNKTECSYSEAYEGGNE